MDYIIESVEKPSNELIQYFREIPTAIVSDSLGRNNTMKSNVKPIYSGVHLCGPALTVKISANDNLILHKAIKMAEPGDILVVDTGGYSESAVWGELMSISAKSNGISGIVIDGAVRDIRKIIELRFPVFCTSIVPRAPYSVHSGSINVAILCGGTIVSPGDTVIGDDDGVVVVPREKVEEVLVKCKTKIEEEEEIRLRVTNGEFMYDILGFKRYFDCLEVSQVKNDRE